MIHRSSTPLYRGLGLNPFATAILSVVVVVHCLVWAGRAIADEAVELDQQQDVVYGTGGGEDLLLDWARPKQFEGKLPAIIYIHGGGWAGGNKNIHRGHMEAAARRGYFSATIGYRLAPKHKFPAQVNDCKCAIRWLRAHADELHLDPERIGTVGFSAGAHLVMMLGTMDPDDGLEGDGGWADQSSKVQAVVSFAGPVNLQSELPEISQKILRDFIGGTQAEKPEAHRLASPITYVNAGDAPMLLYQGTKDPLVPYDQAIEMVRAMEKAGVPGRVEMLIGAGHGWGGYEHDRSLDASIKFLAEHLKAKTQKKTAEAKKN